MIKSWKIQKMKKILTISLIIIVILISNGCVQEHTKEELSELQITACNSADEGNTCDTKLEDLGIVTKEQCCGILGKCCGGA